MPRRVFLAAAALLAAGAPRLPAGASYPMVLGIRPVAIQAGTAAERTVHSRYSTEGAYRVFVSGAGVTGEAADARPKAEAPAKAAGKSGKRPSRRPAVESLSVRFHAEKNAACGVRDVRVACARGVSTVGQLVVVQDPVIEEAGDNDSPEKAQTIALPAAVCGSIEKREDRDCFKFHVEAGRSLAFCVHGMALEDRIHDLQLHFDPIIILRDASGGTVAVADNDIAGDPILFQRFATPGDYTLEIRDVRYKGDRDWVYCIEINDRPFVRTVFPLAVAAGQHVKFEPAGPGIAAAASALDWTVPSTWSAGLHRAQLPQAAGRTNPVTLLLTDLPRLNEQSAEHAAPKSAQAVPVPAAVNGRIRGATDVDVYSFTAKKGTVLSFEIIARRAGSPLDASLRILDAKGNSLGEGDDLSSFVRTSADAIIENWRAPLDGTYCVEVRDLLGRGGADFNYCLKIAPTEPAFELYLDTDKTELAPGTRGVIFANAVRKNGFDGEIALSISGLPDGVTAFCDVIPRGHRDGCIILTASPRAGLAAGNVAVAGTARVKGRSGKMVERRVVAVPLQETYLPGGGRGHWPVETHTVGVGEPSDLRSVKLGTNQITLKPGESVRVDVTIERAPGFTDNVLLDSRFDHLGRIYGDTLPRGVEIDAKKSKTLLGANETHGFITFRAAPNVEAMEKRPVPVMANVSINFVMKSTYSSDPLFVTTRR